MFKVTKEWIDDNTNGGTINNSQLVILNQPKHETEGLKGWKARSIGMNISNARRGLFERLKGLSSGLQRLEIDKFKSEKSRVQNSLF